MESSKNGEHVNKSLSERSIAQAIPVFRTNEFSIKAINSALDQEGHDSNLLVVTTSPDFVLSHYPRRNFLDVIHVKPPCPPGKARNIALNALNDFQLVSLLDDDDLASKSRLQHISDQTLKADLAFGDLEYVDSEETPVSIYRRRGPRLPYLELELLFRNPIHQSSVTLNPSVALSVGGYRQDMIRFSDYELWLRMASEGLTFHRIEDQPLGKYRIHPHQISRQPEIRSFDRWCVREARALLARRITDHDMLAMSLAASSDLIWTAMQQMRSMRKPRL